MISPATKTMESAMAASTGGPGTCIQPSVAAIGDRVDLTKLKIGRPKFIGEYRRNRANYLNGMVGREGLEPSTNGLRVRCSTN
jgi:hypothetical protein